MESFTCNFRDNETKVDKEMVFLCASLHILLAYNCPVPLFEFQKAESIESFTFDGNSNEFDV